MPQKTAPSLKTIFQVLHINLVSNLPILPKVFFESKIASYFDINAVPKDWSFQLLETSPEKIYILKCLKPSKAAAIDNLPGKFLKYGAHVLARLISELCNLSSKLNCFQEAAKSLKLNLSLKKALRPILKTTALFHSSPPPTPLIKSY